MSPRLPAAALVSVSAADVPGECTCVVDLDCVCMYIVWT